MNINLAPDSHRYLAMAKGERVSSPFNRRVILPLVLGSELRWWWLASFVSCLLICLLTSLWALKSGLPWQAVLFSFLIMAGLPQIPYWLKTPVLTDAPAMATALVSSLLPWPWNLLVACIGGFMRETTPIFAALYAWNPILLLALIPIGIYSWLAPVGKDPLGREEWHRHPFKTSMKWHSGKWLDIQHMILPWGAGVFSLCFLSWQLVLTVVAAYAQLLVATDTSRLIVWAAPVVAMQLAHIDPFWMPVLVIAHWFNPYRGEGY